MSYILDALKKSEQERTRGATPTLHAVHTESFPQARLAPWHYVLIPVVLAISAMAVWQRPWQAEKSGAQAADVPRLAAVVAPLPHRPAPQAIPAMDSNPAVEANQEVHAPAVPAPVLRSEKPFVAESAPIKDKPARLLPPVATAPSLHDAAPPKPQVEGVARAPSRQEIIDISELPAAVQSSLPTLTVSGYVTNPDDPSVRMVGIGNQILGEGDEVTPGLKLEKIAETAAIFAYKGYRFRLSLP